MQTPTPLEAAERFIAGFEDDASQEGVEHLLAQLRQAIKARQAMLRNLEEITLPGLGLGRQCNVSCGLGLGRQCNVSCGQGHLVIEVSDQAGNEDRLDKRYECPAGWNSDWFHPSYWDVSKTRIANDGSTWRNYSGPYVTDDFGSLVKVPK